MTAIKEGPSIGWVVWCWPCICWISHIFCNRLFWSPGSRPRSQVTSTGKKQHGWEYQSLSRRMFPPHIFGDWISLGTIVWCWQEKLEGKIKIWLIGVQMKLILCNTRSIITSSAQKEIIGLVLLRISIPTWNGARWCSGAKPLFIFNMLSVWVTQFQPRVTNLFTSLQIFTRFRICSEPDHHSDQM